MEVSQPIGLVEWTNMGKGERELVEKIADWRGRLGSTVVNGGTDN